MAPTGPPIGRLIYGRRFVLLFAHFYSFPAPLPGTLLSFLLVFFSHMCVPRGVSFVVS